MENMTLLKHLDFFKNLTSQELSEINKITGCIIFKKGQEIVKQGTACDAIYIIKLGSAQIFKDEKLLITLDKGSPLGEISFVDKGKRSATAVAETDSVLIKISIDALEKLMEKEREIAYKIFRSIATTLCQRLRDANETLLLIAEENSG